MESIVNKMQRMNQVEQILLAHPEGLKQIEIARKTGLSAATISRYIRDLTFLVPVREEEGLVWLDPADYLQNITLNIHEALSLCLAVNMISDRSDSVHPHAACALRKIGSSLAKQAPVIGEEILEAAEGFEAQYRRKDFRFNRNLETLNHCWLENRVAIVSHFSRSRGEPVEYRLKIIKILPYAVGFSLHLIGYSITEGQLRTLKVNRIEKVEKGEDCSDLEISIDIKQMLKEAWGIWYSTAPPIPVVLRFSPKVAYRVKETVWHPSQELEELEGGWLLWKGRIAEPKEMFYWIRGWGQDVEILEPADLRRAMREEVKGLVAMYGVESGGGCI